jgi:FAD/FMN-containing dehydrogenase
MVAPLSQDQLIQLLTRRIPSLDLRSDPTSLRHYGKDWLRDYEPRPSLIVLPASREEAIEVVRCCHEERIPLVPSGGRTGLSGGATATNHELVLSFERLSTIHKVDRTARIVRCDAGVVTQRVCDRAAENNLYFPIAFSSMGSSQIGGNIATNAGGVRVLRYGNIRDWVLGLEVVTGSGEVLTLNGDLVKNNAGYDLRQCFIGSEGTLGCILEATLRLTEPPGELTRMILGIPTATAALELYTTIRGRFPTVSVFELMDRISIETVIEHTRLKFPLSTSPEWVVLVELEHTSERLRDDLLAFLGEALERGVVSDGAISESRAHADLFLNFRERIPEVLSGRFTIHKNDVSVGVSDVARFITDLRQMVEALYPGLRAAVFGHIGDGNLHVNIMKPPEWSDDEFFARCHQADTALFGLVSRYRGSIAAEHGVGLLKRDFLSMSRSPAEIECMRAMKRVFDPRGILNPGKIFAAAG